LRTVPRHLMACLDVHCGVFFPAAHTREHSLKNRSVEKRKRTACASVMARSLNTKRLRNLLTSHQSCCAFEVRNEGPAAKWSFRPCLLFLLPSFAEVTHGFVLQIGHGCEFALERWHSPPDAQLKMRACSTQWQQLGKVVFTGLQVARGRPFSPLLPRLSRDAEPQMGGPFQVL
jgi:hypothetical protein